MVKNAIFYQIYPTSFYDSDDDGVGDLNGISQRVEYLKGLGINAVWLNPFYKSPFFDGGYDVEDYYKVDKKFGTLKDFDNLLHNFHKNGIKVVVDLVIGHTSVKHKWFKQSAKDEMNKYSDYYIWTDCNFNKYKDKSIHGLYARDGGYVINYYACQPALNYGFNKIEESDKKDDYSRGYNWQMHYTDERLKPLREEILNIMRFWLKKGVDGFKVDLANSLVKGCVYNSDKEEDIEGNKWLWNILIPTIKKEYPDCVFIAEWVYAKNSVGKCCFDVDFYTHDIKGYNDLFRNEKGCNLLPTFEKGYNYFSKYGKGSAKDFIEYYLSDLKSIEGKGYVSIPSGSHDQVRIAKNKDEEEMKVIFAFLLTLKHIPFIYYGDEIGITHNDNINKDGGYIRTGARTPMQWTNGKNRGFSSTDGKLYLPINDENTQSVKCQSEKDDSLLNTVKKLIALRKKYSCLNADGEIEFINNSGEYPLVYIRKDAKSQIKIILNPTGKEYVFPYNNENVLYKNNVNVKN